MNNKDLLRIKQSLNKIIKEVIAEETKPCFRVYKAKVITAPNTETQTCGVQLLGDNKVINIPYSSKVANVTTNSFVWVATIYNSFSNAIVWETIDFK